MSNEQVTVTQTVEQKPIEHPVAVAMRIWEGQRRAAQQPTPPERARVLEEAARRAIETLAASRHLIGKYVPEHHWLPEHDKRIAELKAALSASPTEAPE